MHGSRVRSCCFCALALVALVIASTPTAGADDAASATAAQKAIAWLHTQQQPDGGFEVAGFPGFETPDAVLAIAEQAQTGDTWSTATPRRCRSRHDRGQVRA